LIIPNLHRNAVPLDRDRHRQLKLRLPISDWSVANRLNALFVAAVEFGDAAKEFPIVFVRAGKEDDGRDQVAPIAVLGMVADQNLYEVGGHWRGNYMPAVLRCYPFCIARMDEQQFAICLDDSWSGLNEAEGEPLFQADGTPTELLSNMQKHLETLESEIQRTRMVGQRLVELDLLRDMRFDATLPDGRQHSVDGFLTVDEAKMQALPDATVGALHREGVLGLIHAHWLSMGNMRRLVDWHAERDAAVAQAAVVAPAQVQ
jgi:hypothetical protein